MSPPPKAEKAVEAKTVPTQVPVEEDDVFEEFSSNEWTADDFHKDAKVAMWEAHWDDEDTGVDFQLRLKQELDRGMKE